jgi:vacuolar protein sorting-associated protein 45
MVHELIGIVNGRVTVESETRQDLKDLVLSASSDTFYSQQLFSNFGDLGAALSAYVQSYQTKTMSLSNPKSIETLADMKRFVEEYPEFRKLGGNVAKHVSLVGELSKVVERDGLLSVSEVEQSLASNESHAADLKVSRIFTLSGRVVSSVLTLARSERDGFDNERQNPAKQQATFSDPVRFTVSEAAG